MKNTVEFYRQHFGVEGLQRRTRDYLDAEGREHFDEAMQELSANGVKDHDQ